MIDAQLPKNSNFRGQKMTDVETAGNLRLDTIRQEYARLSQICTEISTDPSYFKYLGLVSALIGWTPFVQAVTNNQPALTSSLETILFLGFTGIVILVGIVGNQELVKWSHFWFCTRQLMVYERELRK